MFEPFWKDFVASRTAANQYTGRQDVFNVLPKDLEQDLAQVKNIFNQDLNWVRQVLKRKDRIIWFLRWLRASYYWNLLNNEEPWKQLDQSSKIDTPMANTQAGWATVGTKPAARINALKQKLTHFMGMPIQKIQNYQFGWQHPFQIIADFDRIEDEWKKNEGSSQNVPIEESDRKIIDFGDGWAWWALDRGYCDAEAKAMGHCGNMGQVTGDQIISLRKLTKYPNGGQAWRPSLTFILDTRTGLLGEMKGRGNEKPAPQYHPYIEKLLLNPSIKGIRGGGYQPEKNFRLADLPQDAQDRLIEQKPALASLGYQYKKFGMTPELMTNLTTQINDIVEPYGIDVPKYDDSVKGFVLETHASVDDFVEEHGDDTLKWIAKQLSGDGNMHEHDYGVSDNDAKELYNTLPAETLLWIGNQTLANYRVDYNEDPIDPTDPNLVWDVLTHNDDDIVNSVKWAMEDGLRAGAEHEMYKAYMAEIENPDTPFDVVYTKWTNKETNEQHVQLDGPVKVVMNTPSAIEMIDNGSLAEYADNGWFPKKMNVDEPRYGWSGYDEDAAKDALGDRIHENLDDQYKPKPKKIAKPRIRKKQPVVPQG